MKIGQDKDKPPALCRSIRDRLLSETLGQWIGLKDGWKK